jgi:hypothetical protein
MPKTRDKDEKTKPPKKTGQALVRRVKKAVRRSRRKLGAEKFEQELKRTIAFLEKLKSKINHTDSPSASAGKSKSRAKKAPTRKAPASRTPARKAPARKASRGSK